MYIYHNSLYLTLLFYSNEAPYLKEWIEYHRMIGFDDFIILNDNSTDDTQCVLDAYASEGIVKRIPEDIPDVVQHNATPKMKQAVDRVFDICTRYLAAQQTEAKTWMLTHDIDEFLYLANNTSLEKAVTTLIAPGGHQSLTVPRLLFGSSNHETYESGLVLERFARRFDIRNCRKRQQQQQHGRRLFNRGNPTSYCSDTPKRRTSFDNHKCMSSVSALAETCVGGNRWNGIPVLCHHPHHHTLQVNENSSAFNVTLFPASQRKKHPSSLRNLRNEMVIMHYMTKSRQEFYQRTCSSVWMNKYFRCPSCTAESYFNLTEEFANNFVDERMVPLAEKLRNVMANNRIGETCDTSFTQHSWDYYQECFKQATQD